MVNFYGREQIFTDEKEITRENVLKVINNVGTIHTKNAMQITRLYDYYKGKQGIYERIKEIRPEICNKVVENWANAIVSFKVGYLCGSPIQYVSGKSGKDLTKSIDTLNDLMDSRGKSSIDKDLIEWQMIAGTSYRALFSDESEIVSLFSVDPRNAFVIYSNDIKKQPLAGVYVTEKKEKARNFTEYTVYTPNKIFVVKNKRVSEEQNSLNAIPIMEYPANNARLSVIEIVIDLLDAINEIDSNRLDGIEQFIQSLLVLYNADLDEGETGNTIREKGLIKLKSIGECKGDIKILSEQLDQSQTQTLKNDILQRIREIVGLPSQGDGTTGDSSNNGAMILKGGWENAETRARESEVMFKRSELPFLKLLFTILKTKGVVDLELSDVDIRFTRRNYENIQVKSQVLTTMLNNEKIHPKLAYESCGMFIDPEEAYNVSMEYYANNRRTEQPNDSNNTEPTADNGTDAEGNSTRFAT